MGERALQEVADARFDQARHGLAVVGAMTVEVWFWALCHYGLGVVSPLGTALYFSLVTLSTVGYGDAVPAHEWRIFAAIEGVNGFLLIGWSTAYLVAAGIRVGPLKSGEHFWPGRSPFGLSAQL